MAGGHGRSRCGRTRSAAGEARLIDDATSARCPAQPGPPKPRSQTPRVIRDDLAHRALEPDLRLVEALLLSADCEPERDGHGLSAASPAPKMCACRVARGASAGFRAPNRGVETRFQLLGCHRRPCRAGRAGGEAGQRQLLDMLVILPDPLRTDRGRTLPQGMTPLLLRRGRCGRDHRYSVRL